MAPASTIGLLAMSPNGAPSIRTSAVIMPGAKSRRNSSTEPVSHRVAITLRLS